MTALTWYLTNNSASVGSDLSETDPGAEAYRSPVTGWVVSTGSTNHSPYANDVEQAASTFADTAPPDGSLDTTNGDFWASPAPLSGDFASANWNIHVAVRANNNGGSQDGRARVRLFRGANQDGSSATEITSAQQQGGLVSNLATSATQVSTATFNPGAFSVSNEYVFVQVAWERTGAGGMTTSDVNLRIGHGSGTGSRVVTSDFTPSAQTVTVTSATATATPNDVSVSITQTVIPSTAAGSATPNDVSVSLGGIVASPDPATATATAQNVTTRDTMTPSPAVATAAAQDGSAALGEPSLATFLFGQRGYSPTTAGTTVYAALAMGGFFGFAQTHVAEADAETIYRHAGTIRQYYVNIFQNDTTGGSTYTLRKNGADTSVSVTVSAGTTGLFVDSTNSASIAAGDKIAVKKVVGAGGTNFRDGPGMGAVFDASTTGLCVAMHAQMETVDFNVASTTRYMGVVGAARTGSQWATEAITELRMVACDVKNADVYVPTNGRSTSTAFTLRKNGSDTALVVTVGAGLTGHFEETSTTVAYADGDLASWSGVTGTGTGSCLLGLAKVEAVSTNGQFMFGTAAEITGLLAASTTYYIACMGTENQRTTSTDEYVRAGTMPFRVRRLSVYFSSNSATGSSTCTLRKNGSDTALAVTISAGQTGRFENTSDSVLCTDFADQLQLKVAVGTGTGGVLDFWSQCYVAAYEGPQTVTPSTSTATAVANNVDVGGPVVVDPAVAATIANNVTITLGGLTISLTPATATATAHDVTVTLGALTVIVDPAIATAIANDVSASSGVVVTVATAIATATGQDVTVTLGGITFTVSPATAAATANDVTTILGGITAQLSTAIATAAAQDVSVSLSLTVALGVALAVATGQDVTITLGAVVVTVTPAVATAVANDGTVILGGLTVTVDTATAIAQAFDVSVLQFSTGLVGWILAVLAAARWFVPIDFSQLAVPIQGVRRWSVPITVIQ